MANLNFALWDYNGEKSTFRPRVADAVGDAAITALFGAIGGVTVGTLDTVSLVTSVNKDAGSSVKSADPDAVRELKWLVRYQGVTSGKIYHSEVATPMSSLLKTNSDEMELASGAGATLVTAWEAAVLGDDDEAVTVLDIRRVGRNL